MHEEARSQDGNEAWRSASDTGTQWHVQDGTDEDLQVPGVRSYLL
jgi:hypothetical protein